MSATFALLSQTGRLLDLGLGSRTSGAATAKVAADSPDMISDDYHANQLGRLVTAIVGRRLPTMAWHTDSYPGLFAGLADPAHADSILRRMRDDWQVWEAMQLQTSAFWGRVRNRSPFATKRVQQVTSFLGGLGSSRYLCNTPGVGRLWPRGRTNSGCGVAGASRLQQGGQSGACYLPTLRLGCHHGVRQLRSGLLGLALPPSATNRASATRERIASTGPCALAPHSTG